MIRDAFPDADRALLAEGPLWDSVSRRLVWVDMNGAVWMAGEDGVATKTEIGGYVAAAAISRDGGLIVVRRNRIGSIDNDEGRGVPRLSAGFRFNDAGCDRAGRPIIGVTRDDRKAGAGSLISVERDGTIMTRADGLTLPNGLGWNAAGDVFFLADSGQKLILSARYDERTGSIGILAPIVRIGRGEPDGLCVCADDSIWVALWDGGCVRRYSARGALLEQIDLPVSRPTSCAVDDRGSLYITTAAFGLDPVEVERQPLAGRVLKIDAAGPPGLPAGRWRL